MDRIIGLFVIGVLLGSLYFVGSIMVDLNDGRVSNMVESMVGVK